MCIYFERQQIETCITFGVAFWNLLQRFKIKRLLGNHLQSKEQIMNKH